MQIYYQTSTLILYYNAVYIPGANALGIRVLEYIFEVLVLVLVEIMDHVLVLWLRSCNSAVECIHCVAPTIYIYQIYGYYHVSVFLRMLEF